MLDCRFAFEHRPGHIKGAKNTSEPQQVESELQKLLNCGPLVVSNTPIVLHCEFSSQRAPRLFRHIRSNDRKYYLEQYPHLAFPHLYVLDGGYKAFYALYPDLCVSDVDDSKGLYVSMFNEKLEQEFEQEQQRHKVLFQQSKLVTNGFVKLNLPPFISS